MNFQLTADQQTFRDSVLRLSEKHLKADARERAHAVEYPWDVARLFAANGLLGITIAEKDGGQGGSLMDAVLAIEAVASVCPRSADVIQAGNFGPVRVLAEYGTLENVIANAEGEASRFKQILVEYNRAPGVTRDRMYLETMQQIMTSTTKIFIDARAGTNLLYLPLDKLVQMIFLSFLLVSVRQQE